MIFRDYIFFVGKFYYSEIGQEGLSLKRFFSASDSFKKDERKVFFLVTKYLLLKFATMSPLWSESILGKLLLYSGFYK